MFFRCTVLTREIFCNPYEALPVLRYGSVRDSRCTLPIRSIRWVCQHSERLYKHLHVPHAEVVCAVGRLIWTFDLDGGVKWIGFKR